MEVGFFLSVAEKECLLLSKSRTLLHGAGSWGLKSWGGMNLCGETRYVWIYVEVKFSPMATRAEKLQRLTKRKFTATQRHESLLPENSFPRTTYEVNKPLLVVDLIARSPPK